MGDFADETGDGGVAEGGFGMDWSQELATSRLANLLAARLIMWCSVSDEIERAKVRAFSIGSWLS
ncbi:MAG: hypothetical protein ACJAQT_000300 [Akkermansiaceae bacterium]